VIRIREAAADDADAIWAILEPVIRAGETYTLDRDLTREAALATWTGPDRETIVAVDDAGQVIGTYYLRANQTGGGAHVANCGYMSGQRGIGRMMAEDSLQRARSRGFAAMQFNFVVASNSAAVALWQSLGFAEVGRQPAAFHHPRLGLVDALVMHRTL
jgi:ribosomal protein S18 acetylase RimI-like enzyme